MKKAKIATLCIAMALAFLCAGAAVLQLNTARAEELPALVAHYEFEDAEDLGKDSSPNGNGLAVNGNVSQGKNGVNLAGTGGDVLYAPYEGDTNKDFSDDITGNYTVAFWVAMHSTASQYVVQSSSWEGGFSVAYGSDTLYVKAGVGESAMTVGINQNTWHHVAVVANDVAGKAYLYVDGQLKQTVDRVSESFTMAADGTVFTIGGQSNPNDGWFANSANASFDDFRIYSGAMSSTDVQGLLAEADVQAGEDASDNTIPEEEQEVSLLAHYAFDDAADLGKDGSSNGNGLLVHGDVFQGENGVALAGGGGDVLYAPYESGTTKDFSDDITGNYTVAFWVAMHSTASQYVVQSSSWEGGFSVAYGSDTLYVKAGVGESAMTVGINQNTWHHVAVVANDVAGKAYLYVDGQLKQTVDRVSESFTMAADGTVFTIGGQSNPNDGWFANSANASFDDFRIYSGAMNAQQVAQLVSEAALHAGDSAENNLAVPEPAQNGTIVAHYEFKDAANLGKDSAGNYDLAYTKGASSVTVDGQNGIVLTGKSAFYMKNDASDYLGDYTISLWVKTDNASGNGYILSTGVYESNFHIGASGSAVWVKYGAGTQIKSIPFTMTGEDYHHILVTASKSLRAVVVYIDGAAKLILKDVDPATIDIGHDGYAFTLGAQADENGDAVAGYLTGSIRDVRVYNGMVTAAKVQSIYAGEAETYKNLSIKTEVNIVVDDTNTVEAIQTAIGTSFTVKDGDNEYAVTVEYIAASEGRLRAVITACEENGALVGLVAKCALQYKVDVVVEGHGNVTVNGQSGDIVCAYGDTLTITVTPDEHYYTAGVLVGAQQIELEGNVATVVFRQETISVSIMPVEYTVTLQGGYDDNQLSYTVETSLTLPEPEKEGYRFNGWFTQENGQGEKVESIPAGSSGNKTLYADWDKVFKITYHLDGGENAAENAGVLAEDESLTLQAASKEGYEFIGWFSDEALTEKVERVENLTQDTELYAGFAVLKFTVSFETNGGNAVEDITVEYGKTATLPQFPAKEGYIFKGWYLDPAFENVFQAQTAITQNVTLYAKWSEDEKAKSGCSSSAAGTGAGLLFALLCGASVLLLTKKEKE